MIEWHPGFEGGIELRLRAYKGKLSYHHEYPLGKMAIVVDTLVIEKEDNLRITDDIAAIFLRHNIFDYKNPDDALSIDEYYNLIAYMARYKAGAGKTDEVKADQVTGTLMRQRRPDRLFKEICRLGGVVEQRYPGIYYIQGLVHMPTQVIVQSELEGPDNAVLRILTRIANRDDVKAFIEESLNYTEKDDKANADAVFQVSVSANRELYELLKRSDPEMCTALRELMREEIRDEIQQAEQAASQRGKDEGFASAIISLVKDGVLSLDIGAERLHITIDEMKRLVAQA